MNLEIGSGAHGAQTGAMHAKKIEVLLRESRTACWSMATPIRRWRGRWRQSKTAFPWRVEAGLRSFNRRMPEEINRVLTDHIADLLFCPSQTAVDHLAAEGIRHGVHRVGDVMHEA